MRRTLKRKQGWIGGVIFGLLLGTMVAAVAEDITVTTYYPSPRGVYQTLRTMGQTTLAEQGGNVGIGTATPGVNAKFEVFGAGAPDYAIFTDNATATLRIGNDGASNMRLRTDGAQDLAFWPGGTEKVRITDGGNVGIGTTAPVFTLDVRSPAGAQEAINMNTTSAGFASQLIFNEAGVQRGSIMFNPTAAPGMLFQTGGGASPAFTRMVITPAGNVGIGTNAPAQRLHIIGNVRVEGNIFATGTISVPSDARFKTALEPLTGALEKLDAVQAVSFERNALGESLGQPGGRRELGVLAQELEAVYPELVTADGPEAYRAVDYSKLTVVLLEALKELKARVEELEAQRAEEAGR